MSTSQGQPTPGITSYVLDRFKAVKSALPKLNSRSGWLLDPWPIEKVPNFVLPLPNPTLKFDPKAQTLKDFSPEEFLAMHSWMVLFAPHLFWPKLVEVKCPLCQEKATSNGWSTSIRKITGLFGVWYLNGARYICKDCKGEQNSVAVRIRPVLLMCHRTI